MYSRYIAGFFWLAETALRIQRQPVTMRDIQIPRTFWADESTSQWNWQDSLYLTGCLKMSATYRGDMATSEDQQRGWKGHGCQKDSHTSCAPWEDGSLHFNASQLSVYISSHKPWTSFAFLTCTSLSFFFFFFFFFFCGSLRSRISLR